MCTYSYYIMWDTNGFGSILSQNSCPNRISFIFLCTHEPRLDGRESWAVHAPFLQIMTTNMATSHFLTRPFCHSPHFSTIHEFQSFIRLSAQPFSFLSPSSALDSPLGVPLYILLYSSWAFSFLFLKPFIFPSSVLSRNTTHIGEDLLFLNLTSVDSK